MPLASIAHFEYESPATLLVQQEHLNKRLLGSMNQWHKVWWADQLAGTRCEGPLLVIFMVLYLYCTQLNSGIIMLTLSAVMVGAQRTPALWRFNDRRFRISGTINSITMGGEITYWRLLYHVALVQGEPSVSNGSMILGEKPNRTSGSLTSGQGHL